MAEDYIIIKTYFNCIRVAALLVTLFLCEDFLNKEIKNIFESPYIYLNYGKGHVIMYGGSFKSNAFTIISKTKL